MSDTTLPIHIDQDGNARPLGNIPSPKGARGLEVPAWGDANGLIPEVEWSEFDWWPADVKVKDQDGKGACNGHSTVTGIELDMAVAGKPYVALSAWFVYAILCGGWDRGSSISESLQLIQDKGVCPESEVPYGTINPRSLTAKAYVQAARFKCQKGLAITTREEIMSAVLTLRPLNLSIAVGNGFNNLSSEGVPPLGRGSTNHAVTVFGGAKRSESGGWLVKMCNSWGTRWGLDGFCWLPLDRLPEGDGFDAYEVLSTLDDPEAKHTPPTPLFADPAEVRIL